MSWANLLLQFPTDNKLIELKVMASNEEIVSSTEKIESSVSKALPVNWILLNSNYFKTPLFFLKLFKPFVIA